MCDELTNNDTGEMEARGGFDYDKYYEEQEQQEQEIEENYEEPTVNQVEDDTGQDLEPEEDTLDTLPSQDDEQSKYYGMVSNGDFPPLA